MKVYLVDCSFIYMHLARVFQPCVNFPLRTSFSNITIYAHIRCSICFSALWVSTDETLKLTQQYFLLLECWWRFPLHPTQYRDLVYETCWLNYRTRHHAGQIIGLSLTFGLIWITYYKLLKKSCRATWLDQFKRWYKFLVPFTFQNVWFFFWNLMILNWLQLITIH